MRAIGSLDLAALALALAPWAVNAANDERILHFKSHISVHADSTLTITETIRVRSAGQKIKRGIYRDFPTTYEDRFGNTVRAGFSVGKVTRDSRPEPHFMEQTADGMRVYIGQKDVILKPGVYTYALTYRTTRQIGHFQDFDEIYWNATGDEWTFPIDRAEAVVRLPPGASVVQKAAYTGLKGASGSDFTVTRNRAGNTVFTTTRGLEPGEGLTIAVAWPKGYVAEPSEAEKAAHVVGDNISIVYGLVGLLVLIAYYLYAWDRVGRDPGAGTIVPLFAPPQGFSPAAAHFVLNLGFDDKEFAAAIVDMAVKGILKIEDRDGDFYLTKTSDDTGLLSPGEKAIAAELFAHHATVELDNANHERIGGALKALKKKLKRELETIYFNTNSLYLVPGAVLSVVTAMAVVLASTGGGSETVGFISIWLSIWTMGCVMLVTMCFKNWKGVLAGQTGSLLPAIKISLFTLPFLGGELAGLLVLTLYASVISVLFLVVIAGLFPIFYHLLKAPTLKGRRVMDRIEGFKLYLSVAEKHRLQALHPPDETPELFETYLPYALALGVENQWCEHFAGVLGGAGREGGGGYRPGWYSGGSWRGVSGLSDSLGGPLAGALGASSAAPGSGGGGFSGGGGGGGGGGGW